METHLKDKIILSGKKEPKKENSPNVIVSTTTTTITSTKKEEVPSLENKKENEDKKEEANTQTQNMGYFPMMMYPMQNMPTPTQEGNKTNPQQPMVYMMPVMFCDPTKMPKDMKMPNMPNMQYPFFPFPMQYPQSNIENK